MAEGAEKEGTRAARLFGLFVAMGFLIAAGLGLALTHFAVDRSLKALHISVVENKTLAIRSVADRAILDQFDVTRRLAASGMVRYRVTRELRRSPEMKRAVIFDGRAAPIFIGADVSDFERIEMGRIARAAINAHAPDFVATDLSTDRDHLHFAAPVRWPNGDRGALVRYDAPPVAGWIGEGEVRFVPAEAGALAVFSGEGSLVALAPLTATGVALRYVEPAGAMDAQARWVRQVVSLAVVAGLVIAFLLIFGIGRRLVLKPQVELARSRALLEESEEEARRLAMVAERATDQICITNRKGELVWANRALAEGTGYALFELIGRVPHELLLGPVPSREARMGLQRLVETNAPVEFRSEIRRKDGSVFLADLAITPVFDEAGRRERHIILARDVTETAAAEERLRYAVDMMGDAFAMIGADGRFRVVNRAYREWFRARGVHVEVGADYRAFLLSFAASGAVDLAGRTPVEWRDEFHASVMAKGGREFYVTGPEGRTTWRRYRKLPGGELVVLSTDVTELTRARARAEAAVEAKARFSASISHELRTPLIGVISMAELLLESDMSDSQRSGVELIAASGSALLAIINDILDYSKLEAGRLTLRKEAFDPVELVEDVCALLTAAATAKGVDLYFRFDPAAPRALTGDPGRLRQIATNLIGNAVKFTMKGHVRVRLAVEGVRLRLEVEDTGPGIAEDDLERIFAPYEQVEGPRVAASADGTGLGLAICRQLAELMSGEISAQSQPGRGSVFRFAATLAPAEATEAAPLAGMTVELDGAEPWTGVLADQLARLGASAVAAGAGGAGATRIHVLGADGPVLGRQGGRLARRAGPSILVVAPDAEPKAEAHGDMIEALGDGPARILRRPVRATLLARTLKGFGAQKPAPSPEAPAEPDEEPPLVMLVEDNETTAMIVEAMLRGRGLRLRRFAAAGPAVAAQAEAPAAVILMDMNLPDMTGPEATRLIRAAEAAAGAAPAAILGFTASGEAEDHDLCRVAGMDGVVTKPVARDALLAAIMAHLPAPPARAAAG